MLDIEKSKCCGCYSCFNACPRECITMEKDNHGFYYPKINNTKCIHCGLCEKACPAIRKRDERTNDISVYAINSKDNNLRSKSSSGGAFSQIASWVIDNGGIVFGASFNSNKYVYHSEISKQKDLENIRGSKYLPSSIDYSFRKVKYHLDNNRIVLFSGTSCQINGLKCYLQKKYNNLLTVEVVCHGVPSMDVWDEYLNFIEGKYKSKINKINFRDKRTGWKNYSVTLELDNGRVISNKYYDDLMMRIYLSDICLRPSCYQCAFKGMNHDSDITLADFWGVDNYVGEMNDDLGTSLVVLNTEFGHHVFEAISNDLVYNKLSIDCLLNNKPYLESATKKDGYESFFQDLKNLPFEYLVEKYNKSTFRSKIRRKINAIIKAEIK